MGDMDFSQTKIVHSNAPHESAESTPVARWHVLSGSSIALLICPVIMLISGLVILGEMVPIYSGARYLDYDPAYAYLFNGAGLMKGYSPSLTEHPGTPVQLLIGLISVFSWSIAVLCGLTSLPFPQSVATNPEEYLRVIMTVFLVMNCIAVYFLGLAVARSTRITIAGLACQSAYLLLGELFPRLFHAAPEAILFLAAVALMITLAPAIFKNEDCSDQRAIVAGIFLGLGAASKITFLPFFVLAVALPRPRSICIALSSGVLFLFVFLLPMIDKLKGTFRWLTGVATHQGHYGEGAAGFIDWSMIPQRVNLIASAEPLLVVALIFLTVVILLSKSSDKRTAGVMAVAIGGLIFLTLKHFAIHYLMPATAVAPVAMVWALSRYARRRSPYVIAATIALILGAVSMQGTISTFASDRAVRNENEKAVNEVLARYQNPVVIGAYRAAYKPWAIQFGLTWADRKFARLVPNSAADDSLSYIAHSKKLWRNQIGPVDWSYLDQFERAGRAVLIVQPPRTKIEQQTVRTETLLDQGFGDTVERIIVSPKGNEK
jgi:hypothetical protein